MADSPYRTFFQLYPLPVGKVAGLAVLSQNILAIPIPKLLQIESVLMMVNGVVVYDMGLLTMSK